MKNENEKASLKKYLTAVLDILVLILLLYIVFHKHYREILENISSVSLPSLTLILGMGIAYWLLDAAACIL